MNAPPDIREKFDQFANDFHAGKTTEKPQELRESDAAGQVLRDAIRAARDSLIDSERRWRHDFRAVSESTNALRVVFRLGKRSQSIINNECGEVRLLPGLQARNTP